MYIIKLLSSKCIYKKLFHFMFLKYLILILPTYLTYLSQIFIGTYTYINNYYA